MNFIEACRQSISIDSTPSAGNFELASFLAQHAQEKGLSVDFCEEPHSNLQQANLLIRSAARQPSFEFLLQTHLDTPDPGPYGLWKHTNHNPFDSHIIENKIYGLGAANVKLDFLCKMEAISKFAGKSDWRLPPVLVGTFGEETGMHGALKLIRKNKFQAKMGLVGEPSGLKLITAGKGMAVVDIRIPYAEQERAYRFEHNLRESTSSQSRMFNGKSAHSSQPHFGDSAIKKALEYLSQLPEGLVLMELDGGVNFNTVPSQAFFEIDPVSGIDQPMTRKLNRIYKEIKNLEQEFLSYEDARFHPSYPTLNIGMIRTHEDHIHISGSCRIPPTVSNDVYDRWMKNLAKVCADQGADFLVTDYKRPYETNTDSVFVKGCQSIVSEMGLDPKLTTQSSTNEASLWSRVGIDCISFGPGAREGNAHTPAEHVAIEDLHRAIDFYKRVIERFCL